MDDWAELEQTNYFKEIIRKKCKNGGPRDTDSMERIMKYLVKYPCADASEIWEELNISNSAGYRYLKQLREANIVSGANRVLIPLYNREFGIPSVIRQGTLPPKSYGYTHIVALLAGLDGHQTPNGFDETKDEILTKIQKHLNGNPELLFEASYKLQESLAIFALLAGDFKAWHGMIGKLEAPSIYKLFKEND